MNTRLARRGLLALSAVLALVVVMATPASADPYNGKIEELDFCIGTAPSQFCFEIPDPGGNGPCPETADPTVVVDLNQTGTDTGDITDVSVSSLSYAEIPSGGGDWFEVELTDSSFGTTGGDIDLGRTPQVDVDVALEGFITPVDDTDENCPTVGASCQLLVELSMDGSYSGTFPPPTGTIDVAGDGTVSAPLSVCPNATLHSVLHGADAEVLALEMLFDS